MHNLMIIVMIGNNMVGHHIGLHRMHPDRSSCLNSSAYGSMQWADRLVEILATHYARQEFRRVPPKMHGRFRIGLHKMYERFHIGLPKMHGRFRIGPPKWYIQFRMVPTQVSHSILSYKTPTVGDFWSTMAIM